MNQFFGCMNLYSHELEFYKVKINKENIINLLNQKLIYNSKPMETNIHIEVEYENTIIQNEEMFRSIILSILEKKVIDLSEIHSFCHSDSLLKNSHNIKIIYDILNEIDFQLELSLTEKEIGIYIRKLMEKNLIEESKDYANQLKTAVVNTAAMSDVSFNIYCKSKKIN